MTFAEVSLSAPNVHTLTSHISILVATLSGPASSRPFTAIVSPSGISRESITTKPSDAFQGKPVKDDSAHCLALFVAPSATPRITILDPSTAKD